MGNFRVSFVALAIYLLAFHHALVDAKISKSMHVLFGGDRVSIQGDGDELQLLMDQTSGSGVESKRGFLFGIIEMQIKLVPGNSAGTVTAYYMSSSGDKHDEIDFEFLGNVSGQPYIVHTNLYAQGVGDREHEFYLWFDPTADFHNYSIHWNPNAIIWFVDGIPIRIFKNYENIGVPFPNMQGMRLYSTLWNGDSWATSGGRVKIDWNSAPFIAKFRAFRARACKWTGPDCISGCTENNPRNWWNSPEYSKLSDAQMGQLKWARDNFLVYDYCRDPYKFHGQLPPECSQETFSF